MRRTLLPLVLTSSLALGGCVAGIAANAVGAAIQSARGSPAPVDAQAGVEACRARAAQHGEVNIIDAEERGGRLTVWGTAEREQNRQSFECTYGSKITGFKVRALPPR